jgi:hypothetical protein
MEKSGNQPPLPLLQEAGHCIQVFSLVPDVTLFALFYASLRGEWPTACYVTSDRDSQKLFPCCLVYADFHISCLKLCNEVNYHEV